MAPAQKYYNTTAPIAEKVEEKKTRRNKNHTMKAALSKTSLLNRLEQRFHFFQFRLHEISGGKLFERFYDTSTHIFLHVSD